LKCQADFSAVLRIFDGNHQISLEFEQEIPDLADQSGGKRGLFAENASLFAE